MEQGVLQSSGGSMDVSMKWNHVFFALNKSGSWISGTQASGILVLIVQKPFKADRISIHWQGRHNLI